MARDFLLPLVMWRCWLPLLDILLSRSCRAGLRFGVVRRWLVEFSEPSGHGDCAWVEVTCGEGADEGIKVGPAHREVADEGLAEALFELSLNESNKSGRHVLLHRRLCSEA